MASHVDNDSKAASELVRGFMKKLTTLRGGDQMVLPFNSEPGLARMSR